VGINCKSLCGALAALLMLVSVATAAEVLISGGGVKGALDKFVADYSQATGNKADYTAVFGPPSLA